jgi:hypothetical protein
VAERPVVHEVSIAELGRLDATRLGVVADFDDHRGLGSVVGERDGRTFDFHCTAVADGSRRIDVGARVVFRLKPLGSGAIEAIEVRPIAS